MAFIDSNIFTFIILPILIFVARICDVTVGTLRLISVSRGHKLLAPLFGFFEVLIWIIVISKVIQNLNNWLYYIAYAGGFATGNYIGILIEEKLAIGTFIIRVITKQDAAGLIANLNKEGYGATSIDAMGSSGKVNIIYSVIKRGDLERMVDLIKSFNPKAFYSIEDVRSVSEGIFPLRKSFLKKNGDFLPKIFRKGK